MQIYVQWNEVTDPVLIDNTADHSGLTKAQGLHHQMEMFLFEQVPGKHPAVVNLEHYYKSCMWHEGSMVKQYFNISKGKGYQGLATCFQKMFMI